MKHWFYAGLVLIAVSEILLPRLLRGEPAHFWFEDLPAWGAMYGLLSCVLIIGVSKLLGHLWLMKRETYYDS
jgi:hypothetical protein